MNSEKTPMKLLPCFKDYLWGGERLAYEFGKNTPMRPIAESWELSCHPDALSKVLTGNFKGSTLKAVLDKHPDFVSKGFSGDFPILIKLIDAKQKLSVQVHPNNDYAMANENQLGKNEMWYVVDAQPGSELILGFKQDITKEQLKKSIEENTILDIVNIVPVKAGDCFEIPAGMLHAIGEGVLVAEVQQSSNITYRVYDYNRRDKDGNTRELHVQKAVEVIDPLLKAKNCADNKTDYRQGYSKKVLSDWQWFKCIEYLVEGSATLNASEDSFNALLVVEGSLELYCQNEKIKLLKGETVFIPAGAAEYSIEGNARAILTTL